MTPRLSLHSALAPAIRATRGPLGRQRRAFSIFAPCLTDGVYSELTAMRTRTPFIEAFRKQQEERNGAANAATGGIKTSRPEVKLDLSPKTMSESYHRVVSLAPKTLKRTRRNGPERCLVG
jgi:acyl-coenzyme A thioesterase 9